MYRVHVVSYSRDIRASIDVSLDRDEFRPPFTRDRSIGEVTAHPVAAAALERTVTQG